MSVEVKYSLATTHLYAADTFKNQAAEIEAEFGNEGDGDVPLEIIQNHRSYVVGSVISSASFLETNINEFLINTTDERSGVHDRLDEEFVQVIKNLQNLESGLLTRPGTIKKYQLALVYLGEDPFNLGEAPAQFATDIIELRNELVHYKPEWLEGGSRGGAIGDRLVGRFESNPLITAEDNPYFPDKCLSHGCAQWCLEHSVKFADEFYKRFGITDPPYNHVKENITT